MHIGQALVAHRNKKAKPGVRVATTNKPPREMLTDLITRSGLTQSEVAKRIGFSHTSGLNRYVRADTQEDRPIAINLVKKLLPVLVGKGNPPIRVEEVMALTTLTGMPSSTRGEQPALLSSVLELRFRVEKGTYVKLLDHVPISAGSPICVAAGFGFASQFVVVNGREYLHCVDKSEFEPGQLLGKRAVAGSCHGGHQCARYRPGRCRSPARRRGVRQVWRHRLGRPIGHGDFR